MPLRKIENLSDGQLGDQAAQMFKLDRFYNDVIVTVSDNQLGSEGVSMTLDCGQLIVKQTVMDLIKMFTEEVVRH